jgi:hypothetical protein
MRKSESGKGKSQIPSTKFQIKTNFQIRMTETAKGLANRLDVSCLEFIWSLMLGAWCLFDIWCLEFGV